tara:strand:+ start:4343 stop:4672 length:330 start_codon:yes stop_codon:yes gene_type:complete
MAKHVFPLYLEGASVTVASGAINPNSTSTVFVNPGSADVSYTVADGETLGQVLYVQNLASTNDANITFTTAKDAGYNLVSLDNRAESCTYIWTSEGWAALSGVGATFVS